jgi:multidrug efflux pump subunit AcrB
MFRAFLYSGMKCGEIYLENFKQKNTEEILQFLYYRCSNKEINEINKLKENLKILIQKLEEKEKIEKEKIEKEKIEKEKFEKEKIKEFFKIEKNKEKNKIKNLIGTEINKIEIPNIFLKSFEITSGKKKKN